MSNAEKGECFALLRGHLGFSSVYAWARELSHHADFQMDSAKKCVSRWERGDFKPRPSSIERLCRTISALGYRRRSGSPIRSLFEEELLSAESVGDWRRGLDLVKNAKRVRVLHRGSKGSRVLCVGPGLFVLKGDQGQEIANFQLGEESQRFNLAPGVEVHERQESDGRSDG